MSFHKFLLILLTVMQMSNIYSNEVFNVHLFRCSKTLDPSEVKSAGQFVLLSQLSKSLTKLNKYAEIEGDLLKSWEIRKNHTQFLFHLKEGQKFSNGEEITSTDVSLTIDRQIKKNSATHYNFEKIKSVKPIDKYTFEIILKEKNLFFIEKISYPEFGILHKSDRESLNTTFKISSGNYTLEETREDGFALEINQFAENSSATAPKKINVSFFDPEKSLEKFKKKEVSFVSVPPMPGLENFLEKFSIEKNQVFYPHIGYSYWVSINPNSKKLATNEQRIQIQQILSKTNAAMEQSPLFWSKAEQLYLPDGPGRPSEVEIKSIWNKIHSISTKKNLPTELSLLSLNNTTFTESISKALNEKSIKVTITYAKTIQEFHKLNKAKSFDLLFVNNDFSSANLLSNLEVTFNKDHPLILTKKGDSSFTRLVERSSQAESSEDRNKIFVQIAIELLKEGLIAPIAFNKIIFLHQPNVDLSNWSTLFPEISLWKLNIQKF